jgi:hypothetical protein
MPMALPFEQDCKTGAEARNGGDFERIVDSAYLWANRVLWPIAALICALTVHWTFALDRPQFFVLVGGIIFAFAAAFCGLNAWLWWDPKIGSKSPPIPVDAQAMTEASRAADQLIERQSRVQR